MCLVWSGMVKVEQICREKKKTKRKKKKIYEYFLYRIAVKRKVSLQIVINAVKREGVNKLLKHIKVFGTSRLAIVSYNEKRAICIIIVYLLIATWQEMVTRSRAYYKTLHFRGYERSPRYSPARTERETNRSDFCETSG